MGRSIKQLLMQWMVQPPAIDLHKPLDAQVGRCLCGVANRRRLMRVVGWMGRADQTDRAKFYWCGWQHGVG